MEFRPSTLHDARVQRLVRRAAGFEAVEHRENLCLDARPAHVGNPACGRARGDGSCQHDCIDRQASFGVQHERSRERHDREPYRRLEAGILSGRQDESGIVLRQRCERLSGASCRTQGIEPTDEDDCRPRSVDRPGTDDPCICVDLPGFPAPCPEGSGEKLPKSGYDATRDNGNRRDRVGIGCYKSDFGTVP